MNPMTTIEIDREISEITIANNVHQLIDNYYPSEASQKALQLIKKNPQCFNVSILFVLQILTSPNEYGLTKAEANLEKYVIFKLFINRSLEDIDKVSNCNKEISYQFAKCFHQEVVSSFNYINTAIKTKKFDPQLLNSHIHISSIAALNYTYTKATDGTDNICLEIGKLLALHLSSEDCELMSNVEVEYKKFIARIKLRTLSLNDIAKNNYYR